MVCIAYDLGTVSLFKTTLVSYKVSLYLKVLSISFLDPSVSDYSG